MDRPRVATPDEQRHPTGVIDVGMTEHDRVDVIDGKGERVRIASVGGFVALNQAAFEQERVIAGANHVQGSGDFPGSATKFQFYGHRLVPG